MDTIAPLTTAAITAVTDNVGLIKGVVAPGGRTDDRTPTIKGTISEALATGETLRIYNGKTLLGSATVNNNNKDLELYTHSCPPPLAPPTASPHALLMQLAISVLLLRHEPLFSIPPHR